MKSSCRVVIAAIVLAVSSTVANSADDCRRRRAALEGMQNEHDRLSMDYKERADRLDALVAQSD